MAMKTRPALRMSRPAVPPPTPQAEPASKAPSRAGKVQFGFFLDPEAKRQLDVFAALHGRTLQSIAEEMTDDFFAKNGLHRLATQEAPQ